MSDIKKVRKCPLKELQRCILDKEFSETNIKSNAHARIVWHNLESQLQTEYALVYLHGFTANHIEGHPIHIDIAKHFGMNAFLCRLDKHGTSADAFNDLTYQGLIDSARTSLAIGSKIGKKVILMGSSTGASLALHLAAHHQEVAGLILYSPLIDFYDWRVRILKYHMLNGLVNRLAGSAYWIDKRDDIDPDQQIWYNCYPLKGVLELATFVRRYMVSNEFVRITQPLFTGYYYKSRTKQDDIVSVKAIKSMIADVGTPPSKIRHHAFPTAGNHVINSPLTSDCVNQLYNKTREFITEVLDIPLDSNVIKLYESS